MMYQKKLTPSDLAVGWQKVVFGVKTTTPNKNFELWQSFDAYFRNVFLETMKISKNWHYSTTIGDRKLQHKSKVAEHPSSYQYVTHFVGLSKVVFRYC